MSSDQFLTRGAWSTGEHETVVTDWEDPERTTAEREYYGKVVIAENGRKADLRAIAQTKNLMRCCFLAGSLLVRLTARNPDEESVIAELLGLIKITLRAAGGKTVVKAIFEDLKGEVNNGRAERKQQTAGDPEQPVRTSIEDVGQVGRADDRGYPAI